MTDFPPTTIYVCICDFGGQTGLGFAGDPVVDVEDAPDLYAECVDKHPGRPVRVYRVGLWDHGVRDMTDYCQDISILRRRERGLDAAE